MQTQTYCTNLVSKDHESVISLSPDSSSHTLSSVTHGVKGQEVILSDLELVPEVLQTSLRETKGLKYCPDLDDG